MFGIDMDEIREALDAAISAILSRLDRIIELLEKK